MARPHIHSTHAGIALEYVLVTTFSAIVSLFALGYIGKIVKDKIAQMASEMGSTVEVTDIDFGDSEEQ